MANLFSKVASFAKRGFSSKLGAVSFSHGAADAALNKAVEIVEPKVRAFLLSNYDRKNMGHHAPKKKTPGTYVSGTLRKAVGNAIITLNKRGDGITIKFPRGLPNEIYLIGNSLNYGWTPGKRRNAGQKQIAASMGQVGANRVGSNRRSSRRKSNAKSIPGFQYFELTVAQESEIAKLFSNAFQAELARQMNTLFGRAA